ncbi:MAG: beta-L-arabinofuranosidase domain-containing protein [Fimbriimonas sp.]
MILITIPLLMTTFTPTSAPEASYKKRPAMERLAQAEVRLSGALQPQIDGVVKNWLVPLPKTNPSVLTMFDDRDKAPYRNLLAWSGEFAGKYLTSGTETYRLTGDPTLKATLQRFVAELAKRQDADGYLGPFPKAHRLTGWAPNTWGNGGGTWDAWGHYHAILGLLRWNEETGDETALVTARKIGDLLADFFKTRTVASTGSPEMNQAIVHGLALLHRKTGERRYLEAAERVVKEFAAPGAGDYLNAALAGEEFFQMPNAGPRWESLHSLLGLSELYWLTGNEDYRKAFEHHYWSIAKTDRHNNGGFTSGEQAQGNPYHRGAIETCCTVAWTALGVDMLRMTGDPKVADELELSTLNQVVGYHAPDGAWCTYNTPMEGVRIPSKEDIAFQIRPGSEDLNCCSVNAARGFGMIADWALMAKDKGLALNWYGPSTLRSKVGEVKVAIRQETTYPQEGRIVLHVEPERPTSFPLSLRVPHWSERTTIRVNDKSVEAKPGSYTTVNRTWQAGDRVTIEMDMSPRYWVGQRESRGKASIYRGPILMALETPGVTPTYSAGWEQSGALRVSKTEGSVVEHKFEGDVVRWRGNRFDDAGHAEVSIDGKVVEVVDMYGNVRGSDFLWERKGLGPGPHTIRIVALGKKREDSKNVWINVSALEPVLPPPAFTAAAIAQAPFTPVNGAVGAYTVSDSKGTPLRLIDYGSAGRNKTPYLTWFPVEGVAAAPFSIANPSRTSRPKR